jgi:hypothetical protein
MVPVGTPSIVLVLDQDGAGKSANTGTDDGAAQ